LNLNTKVDLKVWMQCCVRVRVNTT